MIKELQVEKIKIRKENPFRSKVLGTLIDGAKKIAKAENREVTEADIVTSAKRGIKSILSVGDQIKDFDQIKTALL